MMITILYGNVLIAIVQGYKQRILPSCIIGETIHGSTSKTIDKLFEANSPNGSCHDSIFSPPTVSSKLNTII